MADSNIGTRAVRDPLAMRALAHPVRVRLYRLVGREGTLTAAQAAKQLDISHALASHHLRQLAKYGFVEQAEAPDERARPWRVTSTSLAFEPDEPDGRAAMDVLQRLALEQTEHDLVAWQTRRDGEAAAWAPLADVRSGLVYVTPEELAAALEAWAAIVQPLVDRNPVGHHEGRSPDAVPVAFTLVTVPVERTERGG